MSADFKALKEEYDLSEDEVIKALSIAGLIGNIVKENASISGAEVGCQGEVGTACAMAAGMASYILGGTLEQIEYAAEMALEHHLGMTCVITSYSIHYTKLYDGISLVRRYTRLYYTDIAVKY